MSTKNNIANKIRVARSAKSFVIAFILCFTCKLHAIPSFWIGSERSNTPFSIERIEANESSYAFRVTINSIIDSSVVHNGEVYHYLQLEEGYFLNNVGQPQLPVITQLANIPKNATYTTSLLEEEWTTIHVGKILPSQRDYLEASNQPDFEIDTAVYNAKEYIYPLVSCDDRFEWRKNTSTLFTICPFKYYPSENKLAVLSKFVFCVSFTRKGDKSKLEPQFCDNDKLHLFDNYAHSTDATPRQTHCSDSTDNSYDLLIVVGNIPDILECEALSRFQTWKACKGYRSKVVSTLSIGSTPAIIKNYISQEHEKGVNYVLFVGDNPQIPVYADTLFIEQKDTTLEYKGDYWYGCLGGNNDYIADIAIGRFPASNVYQFTNMVNKTIKYEKEVCAYADKVLLVAHQEKAPSSFQGDCEKIIERKRYYRDSVDFFRAYGAPVDSGGTNATNRQVVDQINSGMNIVTYRGHGWTYLWGPWWNASNEHFYDEYVDSLNDGTNSIYFSICCQTGDITNNPCMLHRFMRSGHGAVSFLGFTTDSFHVPNQNFSRNIFISLLRDQVYTLGDLIVSSITKNLKISYSSIGAYNAYSLLCGGDPTLEIWTHKPYRFENVEVSVLSDTIRIAMGNDIDFQYSVVSEEGELLSKGISNEQTCKVRRPSNNFYISIYKHNYLPRILYFNSESLYLQNKIIADEEYYTNSPFSIGYDVTTTLPPGDVIVRDGAKLSIEKGSDGVFIKNGFEIEKGAEFHIK